MKHLFILFSFFILPSQFSFAQSILEQSTMIYEKEKDYKNWINHYLSNSENYDLTEENWEILKNFSKFLEDPFQTGLQPIDVTQINSILSSLYDSEYSVSEKYNDEKSLDDFGSKSGFDDLFSTVTSSVSPASGINFSTRLIDGTASLIAGKVKRELSISFYEKMSAKMQETFDYNFKGNSIKMSFQDLLPYSFMLIDTKQSFEVPAFGTTWIAAFKSDLKDLPFSIMNLLRKNDAFLNDDLGRYSVMIFDGLDYLYNGNSTINTLEYLHANYDTFDQNNVDYQIGFLYLIAKNSQNTIQNSAKKSKTSVYSNLNTKSKKYFMGLMYQDGIQMGLNQNNHFTINENNYLKYFELIKDVQFNLNKMNTDAQDENTNSDLTTDLKFIDYANRFTDLINMMYKFDYTIQHATDNPSADKPLVFNDVYYQKNSQISKSIVNFYNSLSNDNYGGSVLATINFLNYLSQDKKNYKFIRDLTFYGSFLADMVVASKNENVSMDEILNRYAMPVTSYRVKRYYHSSIDISAYPGLNFGYEFSGSNSSSFGISAPIGFAFSWRSSGKDDMYVPSHSLFISAIDIGAPLSYRLLDDHANGLPENIKWEQIFSPGIFYVYGFKNTPLCLSAGVQYSPLLRKIEVENVLEEQNIFKAGISLWVDLPLFSLYKNTKNQ